MAYDLLVRQRLDPNQRISESGFPSMPENSRNALRDKGFYLIIVPDRTRRFSPILDHYR